jgi:ABC-type glycerol-3-phosphate transport system permease component
VTVGTAGWWAGGIVLSIIFLIPVYWLLNTALRPMTDQAAFEPPFWPSHPMWHYFLDAINSPFSATPFWSAAWNSARLTGEAAGLTTITSAMVGFAFARLRAPGKRFFFTILVGTMLIPQILYIFPQVMMFIRLGLYNTDWPWILYGLGASPYLAFLYRQFFARVPMEIEDAAIVDGCGYIRIFWRIFMPLSKPAIAVAVIYSVQNTWNDFLYPYMFRTTDNTTLSVLVLNGNTLDPLGGLGGQLLAAAAVMYTLPIVLLFLVCQRYFLSGALVGSLKG